MNRDEIKLCLTAALDAVDPEAAVRKALDGPPARLVAIGKASLAMVKGACEAIEVTGGVCVSHQPGTTPENVELLVGDHPIPGSASLEAGRAVLDLVAEPGDRFVVLVSGGGSALCEVPRPGVTLRFLATANREMLRHGLSIEETNLVRSHLSEIKSGGVARAAAAPLETILISDVAGSDDALVASGPTIPSATNPQGVLELLHACGIEVDRDVVDAIHRPRPPLEIGPVRRVLDGRVAAQALVDAARSHGFEARLKPGWITGDVGRAVSDVCQSGPGLTVAVGEPSVRVVGPGKGGRNTHAALLAAEEIAGSESLFAALASDGTDGASDAAGAIVDGTTIRRGGDVSTAFAESDSASYLANTNDLLKIGPTGTNVSDIWVYWHP